VNRSCEYYYSVMYIMCLNYIDVEYYLLCCVFYVMSMRNCMACSMFVYLVCKFVYAAIYWDTFEVFGLSIQIWSCLLSILKSFTCVPCLVIRIVWYFSKLFKCFPLLAFLATVIVLSTFPCVCPNQTCLKCSVSVLLFLMA
jgi:hypothetical protein